jgi:S-adenosylhomocysteine hydrolase
MSLANQTFSVGCLVKNCVYVIHEKLDNEIASLKLNSRGIKIDALFCKRTKRIFKFMVVCLRHNVNENKQ